MWYTLANHMHYTHYFMDADVIDSQLSDTSKTIGYRALKR